MRKPGKANDFITRAEAQALVVHMLNDFLAQMAKAEAGPEVGLVATPPGDTSYEAVPPR